MSALRERIGAQLLAPIETEIEALEMELDLLRQVQTLFNGGGQNQPVKRPPVRRKKLPARVPSNDVAGRILSAMAKNGQPDFTIPELERSLKLRKDRVARAMNMLLADGAVKEAGSRPGPNGGRTARTYALAKKR